MPPLSQQQLKQFIAGQPHVMKLATLTKDGWPSVAPVWYDFDGEAFLVVGPHESRWVKNIQRDARVSVCNDTYDAPYTRVMIRAIAEIVDDDWCPNSSDKAVRYLGEEAGNRYFEENRRNTRVLVRLVPQKINSWGP